MILEYVLLRHVSWPTCLRRKINKWSEQIKQKFHDEALLELSKKSEEAEVP